ncbi:endo alpha-1,4 polygalactosaminidase [Desulfurobacterium atlanticum]|uniref:Glycoside-hydrolase family GH114 n=1 Tax=Desulfurobacterium atlanticum TaxID=240169 RepID=A0A238XVK0_9BACT|nr:endo alpha-1,4 polygalactosaminidase [Desulfurobacterium atlanticum]SNR62578.1 Glycoside-hydrolase family GH114 [Desulfurobacterium atlanticum]
MRFITGLLCLFSVFHLFISDAHGKNPSVAVIYSNPPDEILHLYDWIILDPSTFQIEKFKKEKFYIKRYGKLISYVSIGEIEKSEISSLSENFKKTCFIGENKRWKSFIIDIRKPLCREFLNRKIASLKDYDGFMLDTVDSYQNLLPEKEWYSYEKAEVEFIKNLKSRYPKKLILVNRPFKIIDKIHSFIDGIIVESLHYGLDKNLEYKNQSEEDIKWLTQKLKKIKKYGLPIVIIDYLPPSKANLREKLARKIENTGFIPWITDKHLKGIGEGVYHFIPRKIALVSNLPYSDSLLHTMVQLPIEWLGFVPVFYNSDNLPNLDDSYTGAIVWLEKEGSKKEKIKLQNWIKKEISNRKKIFIVDPEMFDEKFLLNSLGIKIYENRNDIKSGFKIKYSSGILNFEIDATPVPKEVLKKPANGTSLLTLVNNVNEEYVPIAITKWGGYADSEYFIRTIMDNDLWVVNPFKFFSQIFGNIPSMDVTTENGRRILTVHIDGDGFNGTVTFAENKIPAQIIRDEIIKKYPDIPHTASVIVGEISEGKEKLIKVAKSIFSLKNVEAASHSFSHPFSWKDFYLIEQGINPHEKKELKYGYYLKIKGYTPSIKEEIIGSINWINKNLLPDNKKVKVFLWTGDCVPVENAVKLTYLAKVYNVNGGDTTITNNHPFLSYVSPMGINIGNYFQIYAPIQNENIYTDGWRVKDAYKKVIQTFKLTEKPYRLKPLSIYYHWYSGAFKPSLKALKEVYKWTLNQKPIPVFLSQYAQKVLEFRTTALAKKGKKWIIKNDGNLRTVKVPLSFGYPDIENSKGVIGYKKINNQLYIHLDSSGDYKIAFSKKDRNSFYIVETNGVVKKFINIKEKGTFILDLETLGNSLEVTLIKRNGCYVKTSENGELIENGKYTIAKFKGKKGILEADCKR